MKTGDKIARLSEIAAEIKKLTAAKTILEGEKKTLLNELREAAEEQGVDRFATSAGTVYMTEKEVAQVTDWEAFYQYLIDSKQPFLLQRRTVNASMVELLQHEGEVPGVELNSFIEPVYRTK